MNLFQGDALGRTLVAHAKLMSSVASASVAKVTVVIGNSFGANNFMMVGSTASRVLVSSTRAGESVTCFRFQAGRSFDPDFLFTWPNANISPCDPSSDDDVSNWLPSNVSDVNAHASLSACLAALDWRRHCSLRVNKLTVTELNGNNSVVTFYRTTFCRYVL